VRVLFLDIDGPIAISKNFFESRFFITPDLRKIKSLVKHEFYTKEKININDCIKVPYGWHDKSCKALTSLIEELDLKIVISSDWRKHYSIEELKKIFAFNKIPPDSIIGETERIPWGGGLERERMGEISVWVEKWEEENSEKLHWVAVDDLNMSGLGEDHYVYTNDGIAAPGVAKKIEQCFQKQYTTWQKTNA